MGYRSQGRILNALILREMVGRYGTSRAGYLWAIINPVASILALYFLYSLVRESHAGIPMLLFITTGWVTYDFYLQLMNRLASAIDANKGLLMHPVVSRLDVIVARGALEAMTFCVMLVVLSTLAMLIEEGELPSDPVLVVTSFLTMGMLGASLGLLLAALKTYLPFIENFISPINRVGLLLSGVIFTAQDLPSWTWEYIAYNPMIHPIEGMRQGWFDSYTSPIMDLSYPWTITLVALSLGLYLERRTRRAMVIG